MKIVQLNHSVGAVLIMAANIALADPTAKLFVSNNTQEISVNAANKRLNGPAQVELKNAVTTFLRKNHIEQAHLENILGVYKMARDKNSTADNTVEISTHSRQQLSSIAHELAIKFNQESVAVFEPSAQAPINDVIVKFTSHQPSVTSALELIDQKYPAGAAAFSLHLNNAKVDSIEWLGGNINTDQIKQQFAGDQITYFHGQTYLVYKNGQQQKI